MNYDFFTLNLPITASVFSGSDTAIFYGINTKSPPQGTTLTDYKKGSLFFINGQHIYSDKITSIENSGSDLVVIFDTASLGYSISQSWDFVSGTGKFERIG